MYNDQLQNNKAMKHYNVQKKFLLTRKKKKTSQYSVKNILFKYSKDRAHCDTSGFFLDINPISRSTTK